MRVKKRQIDPSNNNGRQSYPEKYRNRRASEYRDQIYSGGQTSDVREDDNGTFVWSDPDQKVSYQSPDSVYEALPNSKKIYGDFSQYGRGVGDRLPNRYYAYLDNGDGSLRLDDRANKTVSTPAWWRNMDYGNYGKNTAKRISSEGGDIKDMLQFLSKTRYNEGY